MASIIKTVVEQFKARPNGRITVPEWGTDDKPLIITWSPITMQERYKISSEAGDNDFKAGCLAVVLKACDADGERLFELGDDLQMMRSADMTVIGRIAANILEVVPFEEVAKN